MIRIVFVVFTTLAALSLAFAALCGHVLVLISVEWWQYSGTSTPVASEMFIPPVITCAASLILPTVWFFTRHLWRPRPSRGFPVLPAHAKTADESAVRGSSESAKISN